MIKWHPLKNYDGYFISKNGDVGSQWVNKGRYGLVKEKSIKKLKCSLTVKRYKMVRLGGRNGKWKTVHRLVYENFKGNIPEGLLVRHLNDDPLDNRLENLEVGTQKDNMLDAARNGKLVKPTKLKRKDIEKAIEIKSQDIKIPNRIIAEKFGVSRRTIDRVLKHKFGYQERKRI